MKPLAYYIERFRKMNRNRKDGAVAPHKSVMLITVMNEIVNGHLTNGYVPVNDRMVAAFEATWRALVGEHEHFQCKFTYPFFHLASEDWWHLMKKEAYVQRKEYSSIKSLRESFYGAILPDDLWAYMEEETSRKILKLALLETLMPNEGTNTVIDIAADVPTYLQRDGENAPKDISMAA